MNQEFKIKEKEEIIANRIPPGDRWRLVSDLNKIIYNNIIDVLEAYYNETKYNKKFIINAKEGTISIVKEEKIEIVPEIKKFNIYGELL